MDKEGKIIGFVPSYYLAVLKVSDQTYGQHILNLFLIYAEYILLYFSMMTSLEKVAINPAMSGLVA